MHNIYSGEKRYHPPYFKAQAAVGIVSKTVCANTECIFSTKRELHSKNIFLAYSTVCGNMIIRGKFTLAEDRNAAYRNHVLSKLSIWFHLH